MPTKWEKGSWRRNPKDKEGSSMSAMTRAAASALMAARMRSRLRDLRLRKYNRIDFRPVTEDAMISSESDDSDSSDDDEKDDALKFDPRGAVTPYPGATPVQAKDTPHPGKTQHSSMTPGSLGGFPSSKPSVASSSGGPKGFLFTSKSTASTTHPKDKPAFTFDSMLGGSLLSSGSSHTQKTPVVTAKQLAAAAKERKRLNRYKYGCYGNPTHHSIVVWLRHVVESTAFQVIMTILILVAAAQVGASLYLTDATGTTAPPLWLVILEWVVTIAFTVELLMKVLAEGNAPYKFFLDSWNLFDFVVVVASYVPFVLDASGVAFDTRTILGLRVARLFRVLKLVRVLPQLRILVMGLAQALSSIGWILLLLLLLFYIYGVLGYSLFARNDPVLFGRLHLSMLTLFRISTLEDFSDVIYLEAAGCEEYQSLEYSMFPYACDDPDPQPIPAIGFFVSFVFLSNLLILNLFIGVIVLSVDDARQRLEEEAKQEAKRKVRKLRRMRERRKRKDKKKGIRRRNSLKRTAHVVRTLMATQSVSALRSTAAARDRPVASILKVSKYKPQDHPSPLAAGALAPTAATKLPEEIGSSDPSLPSSQTPPPLPGADPSSPMSPPPSHAPPPPTSVPDPSSQTSPPPPRAPPPPLMRAHAAGQPELTIDLDGSVQEESVRGDDDESQKSREGGGMALLRSMGSFFGLQSLLPRSDTVSTLDTASGDDVVSYVSRSMRNLFSDAESEKESKGLERKGSHLGTMVGGMLKAKGSLSRFVQWDQHDVSHRAFQEMGLKPMDVRDEKELSFEQRASRRLKRASALMAYGVSALDHVIADFDELVATITLLEHLLETQQQSTTLPTQAIPDTLRTLTGGATLTKSKSFVSEAELASALAAAEAEERAAKQRDDEQGKVEEDDELETSRQRRMDAARHTRAWKRTTDENEKGLWEKAKSGMWSSWVAPMAKATVATHHPMGLGFVDDDDDDDYDDGALATARSEDEGGGTSGIELAPDMVFTSESKARETISRVADLLIQTHGHTQQKTRRRFQRAVTKQVIAKEFTKAASKHIAPVDIGAHTKVSDSLSLTSSSDEDDEDEGEGRDGGGGGDGK